MKNLFRNQSGSSLLQVVLISGLGLMTVFLMSKEKVLEIKRNRKIEIKGQLDTLRQTIVDNLDCRKTLNAPNTKNLLPCNFTYNANQLRNKNNQSLFSLEADGTVRGSSGFQLRAVCNDSLNGMFFEARRINRNAAGVEGRDALTGAFQSWSNLFAREEEKFFCQDFFRPENVRICQGDQVMSGVDSSGFPICESIYANLNFRVCLQFADKGSCNSQQGRTKCTACSAALASDVMPDDPLVSEWAADTNKYDPDCARISLVPCDQPEPTDGNDGTMFQPATRQIPSPSCTNQCANNEIMTAMEINGVNGSMQNVLYHNNDYSCAPCSCGCDQNGNNCTSCCSLCQTPITTMNSGSVAATGCTVTCQTFDQP